MSEPSDSKIDLFSDLKNILRSELDHRGLTLTENETLDDIIYTLIQHDKKHISNHSRKVHESNVFQTKILELKSNHQTAYSIIRKKLEEGEDLTGHLSRKIHNQDFVDFLLADWGLHHIHLTSSKKNLSDQFFDRSDKLAFVIVLPDDAFFVDVRSHGEPLVFEKKELLEIIHNNWPQLLEPYRLKGVVDVSYNADEEAVGKLRKAGVNSFLKIGDAVYAPPGGGLTAAGTSFSAVWEADKLIFDIENLESLIRREEPNLRAQIAENYGVPENTIEFELFLYRKSLHVREKKTNTIVI